MGTGSTLTQHRRTGRFYCHYLNGGILTLEIFANTGDCTARTNTGNEDVNLAIGIRPDLRTGCGSMDSRVGRGYKLPGMKLSAISFASSSALAIAPFVPLEPSVSTSSAP